MDVLRYIERNPITEADHKRQVFWQITIPFILGLLVFISVGVLLVVAAVQGNSSIGVWADISLIWILVPAMFTVLLWTAILGGLTFGLAKLIGVLPKYTFKAQNFAVRIQRAVRSGANAAVQPVIKTNSFWAGVRKLLRQ